MLVDNLLERLSTCFDGISDWMRSHRLQLNMDLTEFMWCTTSRREHYLPTTNIEVGSTQVTPSTLYVQRTVPRFFAKLCQLRSIRRSVPTSMQTLVVSLVLSRLDDGKAKLVGLPVFLQRRLESV